jgi:hypothetical protein
MNIFMRIKKIYFYSLLSFIIVASSLFTFSNTQIYAAIGDSPSITITSPTVDQPNSSQNVNLSGTYANTDPNVLFSDFVFTAKDNAVEISNSTDNPADWDISGAQDSGTWSFSKTLQAGTHAITIEVKEKTDATKFGTSNTISFTISRPSISRTAMVIPGGTETVKTGEDFTNVPKSAQFRFTLSDKNPMTQLKSKIDAQTYNPIKVLLMPTTATGTSSEVTGNVSITDKGLQSGKYVYDITFTPSPALELNKTYLIYLKPDVTDDSNNPVYAKFFKFTTESDTDWNNTAKQDNQDNPHGNYSLKTDMCSNCHSTHVNNHLTNTNPSSDSEGGSYLVTFNQELKNNSQSYCMACHDGTMNKAPIVNNIYNQYHHDNPADTTTGAVNNLKEAVSCTSCHNPHLKYSDSNPNLLTDHFVYTHNTSDAGKGGLNTDPTKLQVDSLNQTCDSCHGNNEINSAAKNSTVPGDGYKKLNYNKSTSAIGAADDYSLCLRCHNGKNGVSDINQYYTSDLTNSKHNIAATDGSKLNGGLPCAECHETHGSSNIMMLRKQLGNVLITDQSKLFTSTGTTWNTANERNFCLTCHNNGTELYGKTAPAFKSTLTEHQDSTKACSNCHNDPTKNYDTFEQRTMSAAHAPHVGHISQGN